MNILLSPYLSFAGNCEEAMNFYKDILGGTLELSLFGDMPMPDQPAADDKIMHAALKTDFCTIMASDGAKEDPSSSISLSLSGDDDRLRGFFSQLADGGSIIIPLAPQPWGDEFGMVQDKFGIRWMVNIAKPKS